LDAHTSGTRRRSAFHARFALPSNLSERVGQMVMVGFRGVTAKEAQPTIRKIADGSIGAVVLFDADSERAGPRNIQSRQQLRELTAALKSAGQIPVLVTTDGEGGSYHRLRERYGFSPTVSAAELGERNDLAATRAAAGQIAAEMAEVGIDMNLAPVVDLTHPENLSISGRRRSFSSDPEVVTAHARAFVLGHRDHGVLTAPKHFPGVSGATLPYTREAGEPTGGWSPAELEPYRSLHAEGLLDAVLVTRVSHPELDHDLPCCLSRPIVEGLLRGDLGFDGVVMTDAMEMAPLWDRFGFERATVLAVNAGVDMILLCNVSERVPYSDDKGPAAVQAIVDAVGRGEIAEARVNQACARILALKSRIHA
jgi:beta-N-acetylhexosaminidase